MPERLFGGNAGSSTAGGASTKNPFDYSEQAATTSNFDVERKKRELTNTPLTTQMGAQGAIPAKQDDVRAEFLGLPYDVKKSLIDTAVPVGNNKLQLGSVNSKELGKYESLQFTKEELQALASSAKYEGTQFSQPTGKETYGVQSQGTKNMMDMGTPDFTDYSKDQRSSDVDTFINADTMRMGQEERAKRMKGAGISTIDQLVGSERPDDTPNFFSELSKGAQRAGQVAQRSFYGTMELSGIEGLSDWGAQNADRVYKDILKSPQLNPSKNLSTDFEIGKMFDPAYIGMTMGQLFPHIAGSMASSIAGGLVAGPTGALAGAGTYSFTQEAGNAYNSLLDAGLSSTQAKKAAPIYGVVAASLDAIIPAKIAGKVLNASANNAIKEGLKETFIQGLKKGGVSFLKDAGIEAGTEGAQQFAQNLTERFFFENKDIWEDVPASTFAGLVGGVGFGGIGSVFDVMTPGSPVITEGTGLEETQGSTKKTSTTVTELKQQKTGLEATLNIAQKLAAKYPTNARLSEIVAETQDALDTVGAAYSNTLNQHFQNTKTEEINTPNLQVSVAQTPTGEWVAQGKAMVQGMTFEVPFTKSEVTTTSDAALAPVVAQIQSWVDEQIANPNVADVSALSSISDSLTQLLESPTRNEIAQDDKVLEAQDMSESEFLDKYATPETLPQLQNFYRKANQIEVQQYRKDIAEKPIRELAHDLGVKVEWVSHIATVEGKRALGSFREQTIKLLQDEKGNPIADAATAYHEIGHAYFRTMMTQRQRADILEQVKKVHNITSDTQAEEILVEDLKKQADAKTARSDKYGKVLSTFLEYVKKFVNFIKSDKVATFYDDVLSGKRPSLREEFTREESKLRAEKEAKDKQAQEEKTIASIKKEYGVDLNEFLPDTEAFRLEIEAFRLEGGVPLEAEDERLVQILSRTIDGAMKKEITESNLDKFTALLELLYKTDKKFLEKYGVGVSDTFFEAMMEIEGKVQNFVSQQVTLLEQELNPELSDKKFIDDTARFLAREVYPILERNTRKRKQLTVLDYPALSNQMAELRNAGQLSPEEMEVANELVNLQDKVVEKYLLEGEDALAKTDDIASQAIAESSEHIGKGEPEFARLTKEYKAKLRAEKKLNNFVEKSRADMKRQREDLIKQNIKLLQRQEDARFRRLGRNMEKIVAEEVLATEKELRKEQAKSEKEVEKRAIKETKEEIRKQIKVKQKRDNLIEKIANLKKSVRRAATTGNRIAVERTRQLLELFSTFEESSLSQKSLDKLDDIREMIRNDANISEDIKEWYDKNLKRLGKKSLSSMTTEEISELYSMLIQLTHQGELELEMKKFNTEAERALYIEQVLSTTKNLDPERKDKNATQKAKSPFMKDVANKLSFLGIQPPVHVMDKVDGNMMYEGENVKLIKDLQQREQAKFIEMAAIMDEFQGIVRSIKEEYSNDQQAYIVLLARMREGADTQADNIMLAKGWSVVPAEVEGLTRAEAEGIVDTFQDLNAKYNITERLAATHEARTNTPFPRLENYVMASKYDDHANLDEDIDISQTGGRYTTEVSQGFTISRKPDVNLKPRTDAFALFYETLDAALWYIHMQPGIDNAQSVVFSEEYKDAAGKVASNYWKSYLETVAQRGRSRLSYKDPWLIDLKNNITKAILGFKVSTVLLQPTAAVNAMAYVNMAHGAEATMAIAGELAKAFTIPSYKKNSLTKSQALQLREGSAGNVDLYEMKEMGQNGYMDEKTKMQRVGNTISKASMAMIQEFDIRTAAAVRNGMYNYFVKNGMETEKAAKEADFIMNLTQSSTQVTDRPLILSEGGNLVRLLLIFQTYTMGLFGLLQQGVINSGLRSGTPRVKVKAALALVSIPFFQAVAQELVKVVNLMLQGKEDDDDLEDKLKHVVENTPLALIGTMPVIGSLIQGAFQYNRGYSNPAFDTLSDTIMGLKKVATADDIMKKLKGASMSAEGIATAVGVPGTSQIFDFINQLIKEDSEEKSSTLSYYGKQVNEGKLSKEEALKQIVAELYPAEKRNELTKDKLSGLRNSFDRTIVLTGNNKDAKIIVKANTVDEKASMLVGMRSSMEPQEFKNLITYLRANGELSENVESKMLQLMAKK